MPDCTGSGVPVGAVLALGDARTSGGSDGSDDGAATVRLGITGEDGNRFDLTIRHRFTGPDTMTLTIELPQPISIELVRAKE